ncbi:hypothetical protein [Actinophytocola sediminis]
MDDGYVVDEAGIAARVGELNACAAEVTAVIGLLGDSAGDLGPAALSAAVTEVIDQWRTNLGDMRDKIDRAAENTRAALANYQLVEDANEYRLRAMVEVPR